MKILNFDKFFALCQEAGYIEIGDDMVIGRDFEDGRVALTTEEYRISFSQQASFAAESDEAGVVYVKDDSFCDNEVKFFRTEIIVP